MTSKKTPAVKSTEAVKSPTKTNSLTKLDLIIAMVSLVAFSVGTYRDVIMELRGNPYVGYVVAGLVVFYGGGSLAKVLLGKVK